MQSVAEIEEKDAEWLVPYYIPRYQITALAGEGGSGKTSTWCAIAAAISSGKKPFYLAKTFQQILPNVSQKKLCTFRLRT